MGILNVTPDSFSDGGQCFDPAAAVRRGRELAAQGADVIDVGGESTRPRARPVAAQEELDRVLSVIHELSASLKTPISIDTSKAAVADAALQAGACLINDVTALTGDPAMAAVAARAGAAVILMHMQGTPQSMQDHPRYRDVTQDVAGGLAAAAGRAQAAGIARERILLDPGIGFGKTAAHSLSLLQRLDRLVALGYPVVLGPSRKSFIGALVGGEPHERLGGTLAAVAAARARGVHMVRVHDVQPTVQFLRLLDLLEPGA